MICFRITGSSCTVNQCLKISMGNTVVHFLELGAGEEVSVLILWTYCDGRFFILNRLNCSREFSQLSPLNSMS